MFLETSAEVSLHASGLVVLIGLPGPDAQFLLSRGVIGKPTQSSVHQCRVPAENSIPFPGDLKVLSYF